MITAAQALKLGPDQIYWTYTPTFRDLVNKTDPIVRAVRPSPQTDWTPDTFWLVRVYNVGPYGELLTVEDSTEVEEVNDPELGAVYPGLYVAKAEAEDMLAADALDELAEAVGLAARKLVIADRFPEYVKVLGNLLTGLVVSKVWNKHEKELNK